MRIALAAAGLLALSAGPVIEEGRLAGQYLAPAPETFPRTAADVSPAYSAFEHDHEEFSLVFLWEDHVLMVAADASAVDGGSWDGLWERIVEARPEQYAGNPFRLPPDLEDDVTTAADVSLGDVFTAYFPAKDVSTVHRVTGYAARLAVAADNALFRVYAILEEAPEDVGPSGPAGFAVPGEPGELSPWPMEEAPEGCEERILPVARRMAVRGQDPPVERRVAGRDQEPSLAWSHYLPAQGLESGGVYLNGLWLVENPGDPGPETPEFQVMTLAPTEYRDGTMMPVPMALREGEPPRGKELAVDPHWWPMAGPRTETYVLPAAKSGEGPMLFLHSRYSISLYAAVQGEGDFEGTVFKLVTSAPAFAGC